MQTRFLILVLVFAGVCHAADSNSATSAREASAVADELALRNENGTLRFALDARPDGLTYRIDRLAIAGATPVLERSPLGLMRTDADFSSGLVFVSATAPKIVEDRYTLVVGKRRAIESRGVERTFSLRNAKRQRLDLIVRAYRDGIAFRYAFPGEGAQMFYVSGEATGFNLPAGGRVWAQPYSKVDVWAPGYEADYVNGAPVGTSAPGTEGWALPLLCETNLTWVLITETGLEPSYFGVHLEQHAPDGLYRVRLPEEAETYGVAPQPATITLPWASPWRVVIVSDRPGGVAEATLVTDLARPSDLADTSWIKPGMATWSWWGDMGSPRDYARLVPFVDAAAQLEWRYSLLDLGWDEMKNGGDAKKLAAYAKAKGVELIVWYNSAGKHNQVPDAGPKDLLNDAVLREAEFARIAALGIKGVKVDFMQSDKQFVIAMYHDILRAAARHRLIVDFHGCTMPRGWERTHPNLVTMEAVRGAEQYWDKTFAENAQTFNSIYVFTRNAIGPMDYTPTIFTDPTQPDAQRVPHLTTNAHELALLVVFESGVQHVVDAAESLMRQPRFVQEFLTALPTVWDETRVLDGAPGVLAVVARRFGDTWYLGGINGEKTAKRIRVPLAFLRRTANATLISDGDLPHTFAHREFTAQPTDVLEIDLAARGGFASRFGQRVAE